MALLKCKMCGGDLEITEGMTVCQCEYCGAKQTVPKLDDEKKAILYDRANHFRRSNDFDKAMSIYEQILNEDQTDVEAYWSIVLCRYGIEYVEDPASRKRIPTVNRAQFTSVFADEDYKSALQYADLMQKEIYESEAKEIDEIQKGILEISGREKPFDVFICYKETDANGRRTQDSVLATDLYHQLTQEGYKVFFSRITLEDKLGTAYEPYIFAALNSAKVMVVLGTKAEYFNAVWVKNEWSRYLALIKNGAKKMLIPAYRDMDPYDLPEEFSYLQAQDMSKLGFMQDLIRGIKKIIGFDSPKEQMIKSVPDGNSASITPLLKRANLFLEGENWEEADEYCEKVLDLDPENGNAYLIKLLCVLKLSKVEALNHLNTPLDQIREYKNVVRFADEKTSEMVVKYNKAAHERIREANKIESLNRKKAALEEQVSIQQQRIRSLKVTLENCRAKTKGANDYKIVLLYSILVLLMGAVFIISPVIGAEYAQKNSSEDFVNVIIVLLFLTSPFLRIIFSWKLLKKKGMIAWLSLLDILTCGILMTVIAIKAIKKTPGKTVKALNKTIDSLESSLVAANEELNKVVGSMESIDAELNKCTEDFNQHKPILQKK